jgi:hypothetical protein
MSSTLFIMYAEKRALIGCTDVGVCRILVVLTACKDRSEHFSGPSVFGINLSSCFRSSILSLAGTYSELTALACWYFSGASGLTDTRYCVAEWQESFQ